jgi:hypothetical protein
MLEKVDQKLKQMEDKVINEKVNIKLVREKWRNGDPKVTA